MAKMTPSSKSTKILKRGNASKGPSHVEMKSKDASAKAPTSYGVKK